VVPEPKLETGCGTAPTAHDVIRCRDGEPIGFHAENESGPDAAFTVEIRVNHDDEVQCVFIRWFLRFDRHSGSDNANDHCEPGEPVCGRHTVDAHTRMPHQRNSATTTPNAESVAPHSRYTPWRCRSHSR
jgi:hypothetical protein